MMVSTGGSKSSSSSSNSSHTELPNSQVIGKRIIVTTIAGETSIPEEYDVQLYQIYIHHISQVSMFHLLL